MLHTRFKRKSPILQIGSSQGTQPQPIRASARSRSLFWTGLGLARIDFLPVTQMVAIAAAGTVLGALGGLLARGRREA